jgi:hypothetical protein
LGRSISDLAGIVAAVTKISIETAERLRQIQFDRCDVRAVSEVQDGDGPAVRALGAEGKRLTYKTGTSNRAA